MAPVWALTLPQFCYNLTPWSIHIVTFEHLRRICQVLFRKLCDTLCIGIILFRMTMIILIPELNEVAQSVYELEKYVEDSRIAMMTKIESHVSVLTELIV